MEIWLVWRRRGEYGDTELMEPLHRSRAAAVAWCNENRKQEHGDPIQWSDAVSEDYGESRHIVLELPHGEKWRTVNCYTLQPVKLGD